MLNRVLTLTAFAILFLLGLQGVWLYRLIESEKVTFLQEVNSTLEESVRKELDWRIREINKGQNIRVVLANKNSSESKEAVKVNVKANRELLTDVSLEVALQELYKNDRPPNLDTLARYFSNSMQQLKRDPSFTLECITPDTLYSTTLIGRDRSLPLIKPSLKISIPLTLSGDMVIQASVVYPSSVFKGDLLIILLLSFVLTISILFAMIIQARMVIKQVSLAKVKENITHFLTHELRSPLQASITNLEVGEITPGEGSSYFLTKAKEQLYFLNSLIENILIINKFEKRYAPLEITNFEIIDAISPHIARHSLSTTKKISFSEEYEEGGKVVTGDKLHITNAIGNLIDNAIKYSGDEVEIAISVKISEKYYAISIKDNGIGIPKEEQGKIFEKFYRVGRREHSQKGKGFGLGLTYVMWVIKAHNGKVKLISEPGVGSEFTLYLKRD